MFIFQSSETAVYVQCKQTVVTVAVCIEGFHDAVRTPCALRADAMPGRATRIARGGIRLVSPLSQVGHFDMCSIDGNA